MFWHRSACVLLLATAFHGLAAAQSDPGQSAAWNQHSEAKSQSSAAVAGAVVSPGAVSFHSITRSPGVTVLHADNYNTNIAVIDTGQGLLLIDPMPGPDNLPAFWQLLQQRFAPAALLVVNTHDHADHSGGNSFLLSQGARLLGAVEASVAGHAEKPATGALQQNTAENPPESVAETAEQKDAAQQTGAAQQKGAALKSVADLPGIQTFMLPSHSKTDRIFYHSASNSLFVGDIVDTSWHPTFYAGGIAGFTEALAQILALADEQTLIIPGHGAPISRQALLEYRDNTLAWLARVRALRQQGYSLAQMQADPALVALLQRFSPAAEKSGQGQHPQHLQQNATMFIPDKAFSRFIERTLQVLEQAESQPSGAATGS